MENNKPKAGIDYMQLIIKIGKGGRLRIPKDVRDLFNYMDGTDLKMVAEKNKITLTKVE